MSTKLNPRPESSPGVNDPDAQVSIQIDDKSLRSIIELQQLHPETVREKNAGSVARYVVIAFFILMLLPLAGGAVAVFAPSASAAFVANVVTLLRVMAETLPYIILPALTVIVGYYFFRRKK